MTRFLLHWLTVSLSLAVAAYLLPQVQVTSAAALLLGGLMLGFVNAVIRPILTLLSLPVTLLTLGLFYLVVNGVSFGLAAFLVPGFQVGGLLAAILGALIVSVVSGIINMVLKD